MEINVTLIVQVLHFIVAWVMLKWLLLRPTFQVIKTEHTEKESLIHGIKDSQRSVAAKEQECATCVKEYQVYVVEHAPRMTDQQILFFFVPEPRELLPKTVDKKIVDQHVQTFSSSLVDVLKQVNIQ